jgi:hypothetical protein
MPMKTLTWEQAAEWSSVVGLSATVERTVQEYPANNGQKETVCRISTYIHFPDENPALRLSFPLLNLSHRIAYLANALLPYSDSAEFQSCLVWMTDWGIGGDLSERVAKSLAESFRSVRGESKPLIDTPAHLFNETEVVEAQALLSVAIMSGWDCYVIPEHAKYYAFTNHHDYLQVVSGSLATHQQFTALLESNGMLPNADSAG